MIPLITILLAFLLLRPRDASVTPERRYLFDRLPATTRHVVPGVTPPRHRAPDRRQQPDRRRFVPRIFSDSGPRG